jgi:hypothetical protein
VDALAGDVAAPGRRRPAGVPDLIAENERHYAAIEQLLRRFEDLEKAPWYDVLGEDQVPEDLIRQRLFEPPPT